MPAQFHSNSGSNQTTCHSMRQHKNCHDHECCMRWIEGWLQRRHHIVLNSEGAWLYAACAYASASLLSLVYKALFEIPCMGANWSKIRPARHGHITKVLYSELWHAVTYVMPDQMPPVDVYWLEAYSVKDGAKDMVYTLSWLANLLVFFMHMLATYAIDLISFPARILEVILFMLFHKHVELIIESIYDVYPWPTRVPAVDPETGEVSLVRTQKRLPTRTAGKNRCNWIWNTYANCVYNDRLDEPVHYQ